MNVITKDFVISDMSCTELGKKNWHAQTEENEDIQKRREERILSISDSLLDKIEKSISELDRCIVKNKEKTKTVEYDYDTKKPINEVVEEKEEIQIIDGMIDKGGLKQLVSTLKDIKDIHMSVSGIDTKEEESGIIVLSDVTEENEDEE